MAKDFDFCNVNTIGTTDELLIDGYLRTTNRSSFVIPPLVHKLCVAFRQGSAQHLWTVDPMTLLQMKNCANGQRFVSPTFDIEHLSWQFEVYPNGGRRNRAGSFDIIPVLVHMPSSWGKIECFIVIRCLETMSSFMTYTKIECGEKFTWEPRAMLHSEIESSDSLSLSIEVHIHSIDQKNHRGLVYYSDLEPRDQSVEWNIDREMLQELNPLTGHQGKIIASPIYGGMYCFVLQRDDPLIRFHIRLCAMPRHRGAAIDLLCTFQITAKGKDFEKVDNYSESITLSLEDMWMTKEYLSVVEVINSDSLHFKVDIKEKRDEDNAEDQMTVKYWKEKVRQEFEHKRRLSLESMELPKELIVAQTSEKMAVTLAQSQHDDNSELKEAEALSEYSGVSEYSDLPDVWDQSVRMIVDRFESLEFDVQSLKSQMLVVMSL